MKNKILFLKNWGRNLILALIVGLVSICNVTFAQECGNESLGQVFNQTAGSRSGCVDISGFSGSYTIPVAVHVMRDNIGDGNWPPDNVVQTMLDNANSYLAPHFTLVPVSDPNNCGAIAFRPSPIRHSISTILSNQLEVKNLSRIDPLLVCNIWLVRDVIGASGFSDNPRGGLNADADGIVVDKDVIITTTLAHEVGHYLGLHHVWGPTEGNSTNCYDPADECSFGDEVADTPRSFRRYPFPNKDCSYSNLENMPEGNRFFCQHGEPIPCDNIMGFSPNRSVLTQGQKDLMISTINLYRPNLGAYSNSCLTCTDPCEPCYYGTPPVDPSTYNPQNDFCSPCHAGHEHLDVSNITGIVNISQPTLITKDLTIYGTLNVNSDLYLAPGKTINIIQGKLRVGYQGHITSCSGMWRGIKSYKGEIDIVDGGVISKANIAISSYTNDTKLNCNWAFFYDNQEDVILTGNDMASFVNTTFIGSQNAVQLYGLSNYTSFSRCNFAYQTGSAILTNYGSTISVSNDNQFTGCLFAISLGNIFGTASNNSIGNSEAGNQFVNCYNGIRSVNASSQIRNNYFANNDYGLVMRGLNEFASQNNSYSGISDAEAIDGTGEEINQSFGNEYYSSVGIYPHNYNAGYNFYNNCFNTLWWDVNAFDVINPSQFGPNNDAAGNCFTKGGVDDFRYSGAPIMYGIPDNPTAADCLFPDNTGGWDYTTVLLDNPQTNNCGAQFVSVNQYGYLIRMGCDEMRLKKSIDSLQQLIKKIKEAHPIIAGSFASYIRLKTFERHLRFALNQWAWCLRKEGRRRELKDWYKEWSKEFPNDKYLALKMAEVTADMGEYVQSKLELDSIKLIHNIDSEILQSLKLSIDVLHATAQRNLAMSEGNAIQSEILYAISEIDGRFISGYQLTPVNHELLRRVARRTEPEAAYGRALLSYLTGEIIDPPSQMPVGNRSKPTDQEVKEPAEIYTMNPNPAAQDVTIEIKRPMKDKQYHYTVTSITGNNIDQGPINGLTNINVSVIPNGVYIVRITKDNLTVDIKKLIIQK